MKKTALFTSLLILGMLINVTAQDWITKMKDPDVNFYEVQKAFDRYYVKKEREVERAMRKARKHNDEAVSDEEIEVPGFSQYKRWEWFMKPRVFPNGQRFDASLTYKEMQRYKSTMSINGAGNWTLIGPTNTVPVGGGAGRLNFVRFDPNNINTIWVGSPSGGLWKSVDGGATWSTNTDHLPSVIGCTDLAIDPTNTNIMYLATGDGDAGDTYTVGLLKSIDGGATWNATGLSFFTANGRQMSKILIDPSNTNNLLIATSAGIFRSIDAGVTFTNVQAGSFKDLEMKPGTPTTYYASGTEMYRSTNSGVSWTKISSGLPAAGLVSRLAIAVTPANADVVYVLAAIVAPDYGFQGLYKSTNGGTSFTKVTVSSPSNILGWNSNGGDSGGQGWYDLGFAASPTNQNEVTTGGVNIWRSTNGGTSFTLNGHWTGSGAPYVHADVHEIVYTDANTVWVACDGGLYKTINNGTSWTDLSNGLQISQMYGFGQSTTNANLFIQGWQDNGTNRYNGTTWQEVMGGDGMLAFIDWNNDQNMWGSQYNGSLNRSTNGGTSWFGANGNINETGAWVTPWLQDPVNAGTIYAGFVNMWRSTNGGNNWTKISSFSNTGTLNAIAVSGANNQVLWAAKAGALYKTNNGGTNWTTITNVPAGTISSIACSNTDPNRAWITYSGFSGGNKVFQTNDQGVTWLNLSSSLPNIPINYITRQNNSNDALYIATDAGVYFKDSTLTIWQPFFNGLPNVIVTQLAIHYATGKIRASTYGRGLWESDLYVPGAYAPSASFIADKNISCPGAAIQFNDVSAGQPTAWYWDLPGGNPSSSALQNPMVYYNTPGTYPVTLIAANAIGSNTYTATNYITISNSTSAAPTTNNITVCGPTTATLSATGTGNGTLRWWDAPGGGNLVGTGPSLNINVNGSKSYYVDEAFPAGLIDYTGETSNSIGAGAYFTANDIRGLFFDVINPVILTSVDVYPNSSGNRTIEVLDNQGNTVVDTTVFIAASAGSVTVPLNFTLYPGTDYFIKCRGLVDLYRNSSGAIYPYQSNSVNVTNSNAGSPGYYYFFYSWQFTEIVCNTMRSTSMVIDSCSTAGIDDIDASSLQLFPNPAKTQVEIQYFNKTGQSVNIELISATGQKVFTQNIAHKGGTNKMTVDVSKFEKGIYLFLMKNDKQTLTRKLIIE